MLDRAVIEGLRIVCSDRSGIMLLNRPFRIAASSGSSPTWPAGCAVGAAPSIAGAVFATERAEGEGSVFPASDATAAIASAPTAREPSIRPLNLGSRFRVVGLGVVEELGCTPRDGVPVAALPSTRSF